MCCFLLLSDIVVLIFFVLLAYRRGKATVNRFRTKPGDFKQKLHDMFLTYYKSLIVKNSSESRASISRRYED